MPWLRCSRTNGLSVLALMAVLMADPATAEVPMFKERVRAGALPPLVERLPAIPRVLMLRGERSPGRYGGQLRTLLAKSKDIRLMTVFGYARLVGYDRNLELKPDLLQDYSVVDGRVFTLELRPGHRWSDGALFTTEDFRYFWEDMANNKALYPVGPPSVMLVDGEPPTVDVLGPYRIRYSWSAPNPRFLLELAAARPTYIYAPAHYLKQFHQRYADPVELARQVEALRLRNWASLHQRKDHPYKADNPDLPSLQPWINTTVSPAQRFHFVRNPYFHRVDQLGRQLPYIDEVLVELVSSDLIPAKVAAGESDLQARFLRMDHWAFLKTAEREQAGYRVLPWRAITGSQVALYPNQNCADERLRTLIRSSAFRRALSLGINRREINQVIYFGLAKPGANGLVAQSPLYDARQEQGWSRYDPDLANALLDELGLTERDARGLRLTDDGQALELVVHSAGESSEETDLLELIKDHWQALGVGLITRTSQREVFRRRVASGAACFSVWSGLDNALVTAEMNPWELAPTREEQLQWPMWGHYVQSGGERGEAPDTELGMTLFDLHQQWLRAPDAAIQADLWRQLLALYHDQVVSIGTVKEVWQPVVAHPDLRNLPEAGLYGWEPTAFFGAYQPDTFYFADPEKR